MLQRKSWLLAVLFCGAGVTAHAHEFWLMPQSFSVPTSQNVLLELRVGAGWPGVSLGRNPAYIERFGVIYSSGPEQRVGGEPGADPAGEVEVKKSGVAWAVFRSKQSALTLDADKFESYLREEGLESIIEARRVNGTSDVPGRERYSRCAKALLQLGSDRNAEPSFLKRKTNLTLELIPQTDPRQLRGGGSFKVQLLYLNKPLQGALVKALPQTALAKVGTETAPLLIAGRTDSQGYVTLTLSHGGVWLINAVHMVAAAPRLNADWESIWSSLTFAAP